METHGCLLGRLIIGVVWLLAEASWLHFLTLISEEPASASSRRRAESAGSLLSRPFTSFIIVGLYFTLIPGFSASVSSMILPPAPPSTLPTRAPPNLKGGGGVLRVKKADSVRSRKIGLKLFKLRVVRILTGFSEVLTLHVKLVNGSICFVSDVWLVYARHR